MAFGSFDNGSGRSHTVSEINMVPLIDVMLVLLVIFIITAPLLSHSIKINIPQATAQPVEQEPKIVDLAVDAGGMLFWNEQPISMDQLKERFAAEAVLDPQPDLRIRADLNTRYEILAQIMSSARQAGLKRLGFITRPGADTQATQEAAGAAAPAAAGGATGTDQVQPQAKS
ncbi:ExbD/TolR family protein [Pollutimonas harenae]|uniref:Biopolymer transporter ExbD n=1 Tax=Pollutimonas harenae TaxID=657015 RepID=A0A853GUB7_9BURK|nr:biopolymer transporter ExbD [Pollutimonas harenae]NYT86768.1 biopolymer transporter ExbD [Pollutimonas harenae]TEA71416.1 biopolymer transporter ExbD [Pollutimonas harenae]